MELGHGWLLPERGILPAGDGRERAGLDGNNGEENRILDGGGGEVSRGDAGVVERETGLLHGGGVLDVERRGMEGGGGERDDDDGRL